MLHHEPLIVNVVSANVLLDKTKQKAGLVLPQDDRILSIAASLNAFDGSLDIVAIQEAFKSELQHNGEILAQACGLGTGNWVEHNKKPDDEPDSPVGRAGEHVGLMGEMVDQVEEIDIGGRRKALMTVVGGVAFVAGHLRAGATRAARQERKTAAQRIVEATEPYDAAVLLIDKNEFKLPFVAAAQHTFVRAGFVSAYRLDGKRNPATFPTHDYKPVHEHPRAFALDDILVRGNRVSVLATGVINRVIVPTVLSKKYADAPLDPSDHEWPHATLRIDA